MKHPTLVRPALLLALIVASCAMSKQAQTPEEQAYLDAAMKQSTTFALPEQQANAAWVGARTWIESNATMGINESTDKVIATFDPPTTNTTSSRNEYGYKVTRQTSGTTVTLSVQCVGNDPSLDVQARQNAHLLAYFMVTGKATPTGLIDK